MRLSHLVMLFMFLGYFVNGQNNNLNNSLQSISTINSSGGNASSTSGTLSYSIGQPFYKNISESGRSLDQGVQQVSKGQTSIVTKSYSSQVLAYPNPTTNYLIVDMIDFEDDTGVLEIFDTQGQLLKTIEIKTKAIKVPMDFLGVGMYILRIVVNNSFKKSIKIIKI